MEINQFQGESKTIILMYSLCKYCLFPCYFQFCFETISAGWQERYRFIFVVLWSREIPQIDGPWLSRLWLPNQQPAEWNIRKYKVIFHWSAPISSRISDDRDWVTLTRYCAYTMNHNKVLLQVINVLAVVSSYCRVNVKMYLQCRELGLQAAQWQHVWGDATLRPHSAWPTTVVSTNIFRN